MEEIDRIIFVTLSADRKYHMYYVHNDWNYVEKFYAESDNKAKEIFRSKYGEREG